MNNVSKAYSESMNRIMDALLSPQRTVVPMQQHPQAIIRAAVLERCASHKFCPEQAERCVSTAQEARLDGASVARAIAAGWAHAERTAADMRAIRTRFATRPGPKDAA